MTIAILLLIIQIVIICSAFAVSKFYEKRYRESDAPRLKRINRIIYRVMLLCELVLLVIYLLIVK